MLHKSTYHPFQDNMQYQLDSLGFVYMLSFEKALPVGSSGDKGLEERPSNLNLVFVCQLNQKFHITEAAFYYVHVHQYLAGRKWDAGCALKTLL